LFDAHYNLGTILAELGRYEEAVASYERALLLRPSDVDALTGRADALQVQGRLDDALAGYQEALALAPGHPDAHINLGAALTQLRRYGEALAHCERALALQPDSAGALCNRGALLSELGRFSEAVATFDRALAIDPDYAPAWHFRGRAQVRLRMSDAALESFRRAIVLQPDNVGFRHDLAAAFAQLGQAEEVLEFFDAQVAKAPQDVAAITSRSFALFLMGRYAEARQGYEHAIALNPGHARANFHLGVFNLLHGRFSDGWNGYESRWDDRTTGLTRRSFEAPLWDGSTSLEGRTLLVHAEQGLGDTLQFCRYLAPIAPRAGRVVFEVQRPLAGLVRRNLGRLCEVVAFGQTLPRFDAHIPLMSLPRAVGTSVETIPAPVPYLNPDPVRIARWAEELPRCEGLRIGIAWSGNPGHGNDRQRSMPLTQFERAFAKIPSASQIVVMQTAVRETDRQALMNRGDIVFLGERVADFDDSAALAALCDVVISVDTSAAHLAGAIGRPVWVLLPFVPDWRWLLERDDSPWYPSARLFRQPRRADWDSVIERVADELAALA
jgi:tetratricopeptide (TPR) repeat protein